LKVADTAAVPRLVEDLAPYRHWADPLLRSLVADAKAEPRSKVCLHASLALVSVDGSQVKYLYERLLDAEPNEVPVIRQALAPHREGLVGQLWPIVEHPIRKKEGQRLRAAAALAAYDPDSPRWAGVQTQVATDIVGVPAVYLGSWVESLRPLRDK